MKTRQNKQILLLWLVCGLATFAASTPGKAMTVDREGANRLGTVIRREGLELNLVASKQSAVPLGSQDAVLFFMASAAFAWVMLRNRSLERD